MALYRMRRDNFDGKITQDVKEVGSSKYPRLRIETVNTVDVGVLMHFIEDAWDDIDEAVRRDFARRIHALDLKDLLKDPDENNGDDDEDFEW